MDAFHLEKMLPKLYELGAEYGLKILFAAAILIIGRFIALGLKKAIRKALQSGKVDETLSTFIVNLSYVAIMSFVIIAAIGKLGIQTTSFVAILGAAGLAIGLALQGSLSNFASGVLILIFKPVKVGDYIEAGGAAGIVKEIDIFTTTLNTPDFKKVIVPNSKIMGDNITNYSANEHRRVDLVIGISYSDNMDHALNLFKEVVQAHPMVLQDPPPAYGVLELGDSSVNIVVRPWVLPENYWTVHFDLLKKIKERIDQEGLSIPFPQRDVHLFQESPKA